MIAHDVRDSCDLNDRRNWRGRTSAHIRMGGMSFQIDAAPEFRLQCIENKIDWIDVFLLTHGHSDHVMGMDDLRRFIDMRGGEALPVYSTPEGLQRVSEVFPYAIRPKPEFKGYPAFALERMPDKLTTSAGTVSMTCLPHGRVEVMGLVFEEAETGKKIAYYTDCKRLTPRARELAREADLLVLDALRPMPHPTHMTLHEAIETAEELGAKQTWFTHMTYMIDHARDSRRLPEGMAFAYDGLSIKI